MKQKESATALLPRDPVTKEPLPPRAQPGYYPGFRSMSQRKFWDQATRKMLTERVAAPPPIRFFNPDQAEFWSVVFEHLIPQSDRTPERRIPILPVVDNRLFKNQTNGYRFENMPHDRDAYLLGMDAIRQEAHLRYGADFLSLAHHERDAVLEIIHDGKPQAAGDIWQRMSVHRFWQFIVHDAIDAYYAHPWAWDEIGFGGPAYPRAYIRLERGEAEPWESEEQPYCWLAPADTASDSLETTHEFHTEFLQHSSHSTSK